jgi:Zn finger protein HypA/HybF involved in hydrogenase expression
MHESGIVEELIHELEKVMQKNGGARLTRVEVGVGEQAGFSREHFEEHFRHASSGTIAQDAKLEIHTTPGDTLTLEAVEVEDA